jgi:nucleotide-binding universal stress UspA family protein
MIRAVMMGKSGPILMLGVTDGNVTRLKAGLPIDVDLEPFTKAIGAPIVRVVIAHGARHVDVVQDMERGGLPVPPQLLEQARELDAELET